MSGELTNPFSYQASAQISQEIGGGFAVTASYLFVQAEDLPGHTGNLNAVRTGTLSTGKPIIAGRQFAELGNFHVTDNVGTSTYHGGTLELKKQFTHSFGFTAVLHPRPVADQRRVRHQPGRLPGRHRLLDRGRVLAAARAPSRDAGLHEPGAGRRRGAGRLQVRRPGDAGERAPLHGVRRAATPTATETPTPTASASSSATAWKGPGYRSVDVRVAREFRLGGRARAEVSVDVFNLFNRTNIRDLNTVWGSFDPNVPPIASFNTPRDVFNPRQVQLGLKLRF